MEIEREDRDLLILIWRYLFFLLLFFFFCLTTYISTFILTSPSSSFLFFLFFLFQGWSCLLRHAYVCTICRYLCTYVHRIVHTYILGIHRNSTVSVEIRVYSSFQIHIKYPSQVKAVPSFTGYISLFFSPFLLLPLSSLKGFHKWPICIDVSCSVSRNPKKELDRQADIWSIIEWRLKYFLYYFCSFLPSFLFLRLSRKMDSAFISPSSSPSAASFPPNNISKSWRTVLLRCLGLSMFLFLSTSLM